MKKRSTGVKVENQLIEEDSWKVIVYNSDEEIEEAYLYNDGSFATEDARELCLEKSLDEQIQLHVVNDKCFAYRSVGTNFIVAIIPPEHVFISPPPKKQKK